MGRVGKATREYKQRNIERRSTYLLRWRVCLGDWCCCSLHMAARLGTPCVIRMHSISSVYEKMCRDLAKQSNIVYLHTNF